MIKKSPNILVSLLFFFTLFPYVTPYSLGTDIQPWYICIELVLFFMIIGKGYKVSRLNFLLLLPFITSLFLAFLSESFFSGIRGVLGYLTIAITPIVFKYVLEKKFDYFITFLKWATIIYFIVAVIQLLVDRSFLTFLLNRSSTSAERGVTSLASEATYYGTICLFFLLFYLHLGYKEYKYYIFLTLFQIIFLSQSTMTMLLLIIYLGLYVLTRIRFSTTVLSGGFLYGLWYVIFFTDWIKSNSRFVSVLKVILENPFKIVEIDGSVNDRWGSIYYPFKGFFEHYGIPHGFTSYANYLADELPKQNYFWHVTIVDIIKSYYGAIVYELGFVGLLIIIVYNVLIYKAFKGSLKKMFINMFFVNIVLLTAVSLTYALVGVYLVLINIKNNQIKLK